MDIRDLQVFRAVVETGGITRAAAQLHRVPSNITTRIRQLEDNLGVSLFLREGKRMLITPAGKMLLGYAERILALTQEARESLQDPTPRGRLCLGSMESTAAIRLPGPLAEYHARYPQVNLELSTCPTQQLIGKVLTGELAAAFVADPPPDERLEAIAAFNEELVIIAAAGHRPIRSAQDLLRPTMLGFGQGCSYRQRLQDWFDAHGVTPDRVVELNSYHAILGCAVAGMGVAMIPRGLLDIFPDQARLSVHALPQAQRKTTTALIWRKGTPSAAVAALTELVKQGKRKPSR